MLVGGLGSCNYLYQEIKKEFEPRGTLVLQPSGERPWTAICRGAVIRGLNDVTSDPGTTASILSRVSRMNYGIVFDETWDCQIHDERDKRWDTAELVYKAANQMKWFLKRVCKVNSLSVLNERLRNNTGRPHLPRATHQVARLHASWDSERLARVFQCCRLLQRRR